MVFTLLTVFILNVLSSTLGSLKTIFIAKKVMKPAYIVIMVDSIIFAYAFKMVATEDSFWIIISYSFGKVVGAYLADIIDNKLAFGLCEVSIYATKEKATFMADELRELGFSVTTIKGYGYHGRERFEVNIALKRKELNVVKDFLTLQGYDNASWIVKEISSYSGKSIREVKNSNKHSA